MSVPITLKEPTITSKEIDSWLRKQRLKKTQINITTATNALRAEKQADALPIGRDISYTGSDTPRQVIYGECRLGGTIVFLDSRGDDQYVDMVIAVATHEIEAVTKVFLDDCQLTFQSGTAGWSASLIKPDGTVIDATNKIFMAVNTGADGQSAFSDLITQNPTKWTADHKLSGVASVYFIFVWDGYLFGDGLPDVSFQIQGKKVWDPRTGTNRYTATAAVCIADYLTNERYGVGVSYADHIDEDSLIEAADICDELVDLQSGGQEYRYTINGYFNSDEAHGRILQRMAAAMGGHITYSNGLWKFWPAAWRAPVLTLTEDDLRSSVKLQTMVARDDIFNAVRGTYVSAAQQFIETDYPVVKNSSYADLDGEVIYENIDFHFVTSTPTCQRLAKLELERVRQGIQIEAEFSLNAFQVQVPENIALTLERYGWDEKEFEVVKCDFILKSSGSGQEITVALVLRETAQGVFDWDYWEETIGDVAPNTNLPSPFSVPTITGLVASSGTADLYQRGDGTIAPRVKLTWTAISNFFVSSGGNVEIQFKPSASGTYLKMGLLSGDSSTAYVVDVKDGIYYDFAIRAINAYKKPGPWTYILNYFVIGKTAPPENVTGFAYALNEYGIQLAWSSVSDLDLAYYEVRDGSTWATAISLGKPQNTTLTLPFRAAGTHVFKIKAFDTSKNQSTTEATLTVIIAAPSVISGAFSFNGSNLVLDWADASGGSWAVEDYTISYGTTFASSTFVAKTKTSQYTTRANWSGARKFWVVPNDIYGNAGTPFSYDINLVTPGVVTSLTAKVIDNNVLLSWVAPSGATLPVDYYQIKKGATFGAATLIGQVAATYSTLFEIIAGDYTYWVVPVDTAGNVGTEKSIMATVDQPIDFVLQSNAFLTLASATTLTNVLVDFDGSLLLPVDETKTWTNHFSDNSWADPQDQIDAGYEIFIQPTPSTATYTQTHDIGTIITGGAFARVDFDIEEIVAGLTITPTLSVSDDNSTWTDYAGVYSVFESDFRYVKISLAVTGGGHGLVRIKSAQVTVSVKLKRDSGTVSCLASEAAGTEVTFNKTFFDIVGPPQVTPTQIVRAAECQVGSNNLDGGDQTDFEPGNGDFSIACWCRFDSVANNPILFAKTNVGGQQEYYAEINPTTGLLQFYVTGSGGAPWTSVTSAEYGKIPAGVWNFFQFTHDATADKIYVRVNKQTKNSTTFAGGLYAGTRTSTLKVMGITPTGQTYSFLGQMKNLAMWKGRVVSDGDFDTMYDSGFQKYSELPSGILTSMVGFWELGESSGTRTDSHSSAHNLTVTGSVGSRILPLQGLADFTDAPDPTDFKAFIFTESQVRVSADAAWYADGYTTMG